MSEKHHKTKSSAKDRTTPHTDPVDQTARTMPVPHRNLNPDDLAADDIMHLQRTIGNNAVSQLLQDQPLNNTRKSDNFAWLSHNQIPAQTISSSANESSIQREATKESMEENIKSWPEIPRFLMHGVLTESSATAAATRIYSNMFVYALPKWFYRAGAQSSAGKPIIEGGATEGMCETYRNAFQYMLENYVIPLTEDYSPFSGGFNVEQGQDMVSTKFVTSSNLPLLGRQSGYNVSKEMDGATGAVSESKRYLFSSHWQLKVNGDTYDPLFKGINQDNVEWEIENIAGDYYKATNADIAFMADRSAGPTDGGEFAGQYIMIRNASKIEEIAGESDDAQVVKGLLQSVHKAVGDIKSEWSNVSGQKTGKSKWKQSIVNNRVPSLMSTLDQVRTTAQEIMNKPQEDDPKEEMVRLAAKQVFDEVRWQAKQANSQIKLMSEAANVAEMGPSIDKAIEKLNDILELPIMKG